MQLIWNVIYDIICQYYAKREFNIVHNHNNDNNLFIKTHERARGCSSNSNCELKIGAIEMHSIHLVDICDLFSCFLFSVHTHTASLYKFKLLAWRVESSWVESKGGHHKTIFTRGRAFNCRRQRPRLTTWKAKESNASQPILWPISFVKWQVNVSNACKEHETLKCH